MYVLADELMTRDTEGIGKLLTASAQCGGIGPQPVCHCMG